MKRKCFLYDKCLLCCCSERAKKNDTAKNDNNNGIGRVNIDYNVYNFKQFKNVCCCVMLSYSALSSGLHRVRERRGNTCKYNMK